jgi:hypothetical protein
MTYSTDDARSGLEGRFQRAYDRAPSAPAFVLLSSLKAYAAAGRVPPVDLPAWDPDEELQTGELRTR